ncbi:MAG TPA: 50S ribosomal protein L18 [Candidatus Cloacimonas sp.]|jgi:large subunit ribosomal protein L18|nr:large subunit ribosomal protein [Candidatus Cloacimonadota bacterium]HCX72774.1 50S ribosomal protein L18 [Candidatus Cloacimonas sp.]
MTKKQSKTYRKTQARRHRKLAIKKKIFGTADRPRLVVYRSLKNISAQIIDDTKGHTLISASTVNKDFEIDSSKKKTEISFEIGQKLGEKALENGIKSVRFDRNGYRYHGRVKKLAEGARKAGLIL